MPIEPKCLNNGLAMIRPIRNSLRVDEFAMLERWPVGTIKYEDHDDGRLTKEFTKFEEENTKLARGFVLI